LRFEEFQVFLVLKAHLNGLLFIQKFLIGLQLIPPDGEILANIGIGGVRLLLFYVLELFLEVDEVGSQRMLRWSRKR
jgi:hypothetical protein